MDGYDFHERRLAKGELLLGLSGSLAAHLAVVAVALILPWAMPRKTVQIPFYSVNLVSVQDLGETGSAGSKKAESTKSPAAPKASGGAKAASSPRRRTDSAPIVPVKRLRFDEDARAKDDSQIKRLPTKEAPELPEPAEPSVSIDKDLDSLIPKPKARPKPSPIAQEPPKAETKTAAVKTPAGPGHGQQAPGKETEAEKGASGTAKGEGGSKSKGGPSGDQAGRAGGSAAGSAAGSSAGHPDGAAVGLARRLYYTEVWNAIRRQWALPEFLKSQKLEAVLVVVVRRDGKITSIRFEKKSGQPLFDESVERAVRKADPLPPFPEIYSPPKEEIGLRFRPEDYA